MFTLTVIPGAFEEADYPREVLAEIFTRFGQALRTVTNESSGCIRDDNGRPLLEFTFRKP